MKKGLIFAENFRPRFVIFDCFICGKKIKYHMVKKRARPLRKYCSKECQRLAKNRLNLKYYREKKKR